MLFGDVDAVQQKASLTPADPAHDVPLTISGRTSCELPLGASSATPGVNRASS